MPRNPRRYDLEQRDYNSKPSVKKDNAARKRARRKLEKEGVVKKFDGKDVDHKKALSKGGGNGRSNLRAVPKSKNRSFARTKTGKMKSK
jgi:5-methylcytosine-specific restriction endonuclease McrA